MRKAGSWRSGSSRASKTRSKSFALESRAYHAILEDNWARFKQKWGLPADRPYERHYSPEELDLSPYVRAQHFIAPWKALEPIHT